MTGVPKDVTLIVDDAEKLPWTAFTVTVPGSPGSFRVAAPAFSSRNVPALAVHTVEVRVTPFASESKPRRENATSVPAGASAKAGLKSRRARAPGRTVTLAFARTAPLGPRARTSQDPAVCGL